MELLCCFLGVVFYSSVRLRNFCKSTKVDRFRKEIRRLTRQIEANSVFINKKRTSISLLPNDLAAASFLEDEKKSGSSPLSQYVATLRQRAQERNDALKESSVIVGDGSSKFGEQITSNDEYDDSESDENANRLTSERDSKNKQQKNVRKKTIKHTEVTAVDEDVVEDLVLSSDEEDNLEGDDDDSEVVEEQSNNKRKHGKDMHKGKRNAGNRKPKKRKKSHGR